MVLVLFSPSFREILYKACLLISTKHKVNTVYLAHLLCLELRIASCNDNEGTGVLPYKPMYSLTTFMVGNISYRTCVYQTNISLLVFPCFHYTHIGEKFCEGRSFREVQFASQSIVSGFLSLKYRTVYHSNCLVMEEVLCSELIVCLGISYYIISI